MKINSATFEISAPNLDACPPERWPEFAFIGRSNVGKSSLINLLTGRRDLAKVSATPGKTQLINFFRINGAWCLVDLPGYGYARVAKESRADFNEAVADYLEHRGSLRRVFVLIDSRLPPQKIDLEFLQWVIEDGGPFALVFTKADKQSATRTAAAVAEFLQAIAAWCPEPPPFFVSSAKTQDGRSDILAFIQRELALKA